MSLAFAALQSFLLKSSGLSLDRDKQYLVEARLMPVARQAGLASLNELISKIETDRALAKKVTEAMTINETCFFRDRQPFEGFRKAILPELLKSRAKTRRLRIWSAACSTLRGRKGSRWCRCARSSPPTSPSIRNTPICGARRGVSASLPGCRSRQEATHSLPFGKTLGQPRSPRSFRWISRPA